MKWLSFKEWKQLGYIVKKGQHSTRVNDDYKATYLFSENQVVKIKDKENKKC